MTTVPNPLRALPTVSGLAALFCLAAAALHADDFTYATNAGAITITGYNGPGGEVTIPDTIDGLPVSAIGDFAFYEGSLTGVTIGNTVTTIGSAAFQYCTNLASVTLGNHLTGIGDLAFSDCPSLTGIAIPDMVTNLGYATFQFCTNLSSVTLGNRVTRLLSGAFYYCSSLTNIIIPDSVTAIGHRAFYECTSLTGATIGNGVTALGTEAFYHCARLTSLVIPGGLITMGDGTFSACGSLTNIAIPGGVISIGVAAFYSCTNLVTATIGSGVTTIGQQAFGSCPRLAGVYFQNDAPTLGSAVFSDDHNATVYHLPGTSGWGLTFGGRPTAFWRLPQPVILDFGQNFGVQSNQFGFIISWATNASVVVEASSDVAVSAWSPVATNHLLVGIDPITDGWTYFSDPRWAERPARFYRVRSP